MKFSAALVALCVFAGPVVAEAAEIFAFRSAGRTAITLDRDGARLPSVPGGWKFTSSLGEHDGLLDDAGLDRVRAAGFEIYQDRKPSRKIEDWVGMPRGSFRLTKRAAAQIKRFYEQLTEETGKPQVLSLQYGPMWVKPKDGTAWRDLGDRISLGSFDAADVPKAAVRRYDGVPLLFQMDPKKLPSPRPRVIDFGDAGFAFAK